MKLYSKTLTSLDALEREKIRLRYERKGTKSKHLLPDIKKARKKLMGGKKPKSTDAVNPLGLAMSLLNGGSPVQLALSLAGPLMKLLMRRRNDGYATAKSSSPGIVGKVVKDIAIAYVIGKGLQLAVKGFKAYNRKRKAKQATLRAEALAVAAARR